MIAVERVFTGLVDHHRGVRSTDFVAQRGDHIQLATNLQAEIQLIEDRAGCPRILGNPRYGGKAQAGQFADHLKDRRNRADPSDCRDVCCRCLPHAHRSRLQSLSDGRHTSGLMAVLASLQAASA